MKAENEAGVSPSADPSPEEFAEAAAWVARLHGPQRTIETDKGFHRWLKAKPEHASAFEAMTAAWEVTSRIPKEQLPRVSRWERKGYRDGFLRSALAVAGIAALIVGIALNQERSAGVSTDVGEQRTLTLEDGTRVLLNTATQVVVRYSETLRKVELRTGEALFEVAKGKDRPFVVQAGEREVRALGTSFIVRREEKQTAVTLVEGKVTVENTILNPGQRLTFLDHAPPKLETPAIEKVTAWRRGLLDFENTSLRDAAEEMNRYSAIKLSIDDAEAAAIPITGVFRSGDAASFAAAVARAYELRVIERDGEIRLTGNPASVELHR